MHGGGTLTSGHLTKSSKRSMQKQQYQHKANQIMTFQNNTAALSPEETIVKAQYF